MTHTKKKKKNIYHHVHKLGMICIDLRDVDFFSRPQKDGKVDIQDGRYKQVMCSCIQDHRQWVATHHGGFQSGFAHVFTILDTNSLNQLGNRGHYITI